MKPVLLVPFNSDGLLDTKNMDFFNTIKEATEFADSNEVFKRVALYTLFSEGERTNITWKLQTEHAINGLENKKAARKNIAWTTLEIEVLRCNLQKGMTLKEISQRLKRTHGSTYQQAKKRGFIDKMRKSPQK